jgi:hypothetical protein
MEIERKLVGLRVLEGGGRRWESKWSRMDSFRLTLGVGTWGEGTVY